MKPGKSIRNKALRKPSTTELVALREFQWPVAVGGYEWRTDLPPDGRPGIALIPKWDEPVPIRVNLGLFLDFAQLSPSREEICEFAFWHGLLGLSDEPAETQADWRREIARMRKAVELSKSPTRKRREQILATANRQLAEHTGFQLVLDPETRRLVPGCIPRNLLGAMWAQFAHTVDTGAPVLQCRECGRAMVRAPWLPGGRRGQSMFCSNRCIQSAKRKTAKARKLLAEGWSRHEVAAEVTETEVWLRERGL